MLTARACRVLMTAISLSVCQVAGSSAAKLASITADQQDSATITFNEISEYRVPQTTIGTNLLVNSEKNIRKERLTNNVLVYQGRDKVSLNPNLRGIAKDMKLGIIRYPGGQESEHYHWGEGLGPVDQRKESVDSYGRKYKQYLGILEIAKFAEAVNAQLLLTINYSTGSRQEAKNLVEFCNIDSPASIDKNWMTRSYGFKDSAPKGYFAWLRSRLGHPEPLGVRYWEIGNEIYFTKDRTYLDKALSYARAMKEVDGSIKVGITADPLLRLNQETLLKHRLDIDAKLIDWLSIHLYSFPQKIPMETAFTSNGRSERAFSVEHDGAHKVCVLARGDQALGAPEMKVDLDGAVTTFKVDEEKWKAYCLSATLVGPAHKLAVSFTNDLMIPGIGDRNLYVKDVVIGDGRERSIWNRKEDEYRILFGNNQAIERQIAWIEGVYPTLKIFITEASPGYGLDESPMDQIKSLESNKLKSAIWFAGLMNTVLRQHVEILNQFPFNGRKWGFNLVREDGSVSPIFNVMKMYSSHVNNELLDATIDSPTFDSPLLKSEPLAQGQQGVDYLDAVATFDKSDDVVVLTLLNRSGSRNIVVSVDGGTVFQNMQPIQETVLNADDEEGLESSRIGIHEYRTKNMRTDPVKKQIIVPAHSIVNLKYNVGRRMETVIQ
jgi:alpha-L-arabinofuranosidase